MNIICVDDEQIQRDWKGWKPYRKTAPRYSGTCTRTTRYHNEGICEKHQNGSRVSELSEEYALSEKSIQRILRCTAADGKNTD